MWVIYIYWLGAILYYGRWLKMIESACHCRYRLPPLSEQIYIYDGWLASLTLFYLFCQRHTDMLPSPHDTPRTYKNARIPCTAASMAARPHRLPFTSRQLYNDIMPILPPPVLRFWAAWFQPSRWASYKQACHFGSFSLLLTLIVTSAAI